MWEIFKVVGNELGRFTVSCKNDQYKVMGTGMLKPRYFPSAVEAEEFAQDQLLIITLENEQLIAAQ